MREFELIHRFFEPLGSGLGDDAAVWSPAPGFHQVFTVDTLHVNRHFLPNCPPSSIAHKALAVNLSDCAAMGAKPRAFLLSLSMEQADEVFLKDFVEGLKAMMTRYDVMLIGGDTTAGPLSVSITCMGEVPEGEALLRSGAKVGDDIYVSGHLGLPAMGLWVLQHHPLLPEHVYDDVTAAYRMPNPQVELGLALRGLATSCIDISDGVVGDIRHIMEQSGCGARIDVHALPISTLVKEYAPQDKVLAWALTGGDEYHLLFTVSPDKREAVSALSDRLQLPLTRIGVITPGHELVCPYADEGGFEHF